MSRLSTVNVRNKEGVVVALHGDYAIKTYIKCLHETIILNITAEYIYTDMCTRI